ncbi:tRNA-specific adenosine deaminase subunit TAD2 [Lachnellula suecica]|uniref:tRNA-specific adenosine deaminase subunit TAD2 n=1 Tax=Lachnellula suecica TaxID=602035 RepID=A0A8T9BSB3_9HELO|nr:tRNA-specific adenosine deaminase subunit TAD2 [Lachnellula suecica]
MESPTDATNTAHMRTALDQASHALSTNETPVGCILLHPIHGHLSSGINATNRTYNGTMHAEFLAISYLLTQSPLPNHTLSQRLQVLKECTLFVTVEPCIMCASLLRQFGVSKVVFGAGNTKFGGCGGVLDVHVANGMYTDVDREEGGEGGVSRGDKGDYEVSGGWLREDAILMLRRFYVQENGRAPEPRTKRERVLKLVVEPLKKEGVVEKVLGERANGVETQRMKQEKWDTVKPISAQEWMMRELKDAMESRIDENRRY